MGPVACILHVGPSVLCLVSLSNILFVQWTVGPRHRRPLHPPSCASRLQRLSGLGRGLPLDGLRTIWWRWGHLRPLFCVNTSNGSSRGYGMGPPASASPSGTPYGILRVVHARRCPEATHTRHPHRPLRSRSPSPPIRTPRPTLRAVASGVGPRFARSRRSAGSLRGRPAAAAQAELERVQLEKKMLELRTREHARQAGRPCRTSSDPHRASPVIAAGARRCRRSPGRRSVGSAAPTVAPAATRTHHHAAACRSHSAIPSSSKKDRPVPDHRAIDNLGLATPQKNHQRLIPNPKMMISEYGRHLPAGCRVSRRRPHHAPCTPGVSR